MNLLLTLLHLTLTTATLLPALSTPQKRQLTTLSGGWALRTPTCPPGVQSCQSSASFPGQDACCPPGTTCVAGDVTGDVMCCPPGDKYCGGDVGHPRPAPMCADPTWTLWASEYAAMYFCCESGLVGYANREMLGFGEMCLESGITTETAGGADTLAVSSAATSTYSFKRSWVTGKTGTTAAATGTAGVVVGTGTTGVGVGTATATVTGGGGSNSNTNVNQITVNASSPSVGVRIGYVVSVVFVGVITYFVVF